MEKQKLDTLLKLISELQPYEWRQLENYVEKKYSSKQISTPMPSIEELQSYSSLDFPCIKIQPLECGKD